MLVDPGRAEIDELARTLWEEFQGKRVTLDREGRPCYVCVRNFAAQLLALARELGIQDPLKEVDWASIIDPSLSREENLERVAEELGERTAALRGGAQDLERLRDELLRAISSLEAELPTLSGEEREKAEEQLRAWQAELRGIETLLGTKGRRPRPAPAVPQPARASQSRRLEELSRQVQELNGKFENLDKRVADLERQLKESIREIQDELRNLSARMELLTGRPSIAPAPAPTQVAPQPAFQAPWVPALRVSNWVMYRPPPSLSGLLSSPMPSLLGAPPCSYYTVFPTSAPRVRVVAVPGTPNMALVSDVVPSPGVTDFGITPGGSLIFRATCNVMGVTRVTSFTLCGAPSGVIDGVLRCDLDRDVACMTEGGTMKSVKLRELVLSIVQQVARSGIPGAVELIFPPFSEQTALTVAALAQLGVLVGYRLGGLVDDRTVKEVEAAIERARGQGGDGGVYAVVAEGRGSVRLRRFDELKNGAKDIVVFARANAGHDLFLRLGLGPAEVPGFPEAYAELASEANVNEIMPLSSAWENVRDNWGHVAEALTKWGCCSDLPTAEEVAAHPDRYAPLFKSVAVSLLNYMALREGLRRAFFSHLTA